MRSNVTRARFTRELIKDRVRAPVDHGNGKLAVAIVFAAAIGIVPLAHALDATLGIGWLGSAFGALIIGAIFAAGACTLVRR
jgi:hypothetical protein